MTHDACRARSWRTVRDYLSACIQKSGARNRAEALRIASEHGWLGI